MDKNGHDGRNGQEWTAEWTMDNGQEWTRTAGDVFEPVHSSIKRKVHRVLSAHEKE